MLHLLEVASVIISLFIIIMYLIITITQNVSPISVADTDEVYDHMLLNRLINVGATALNSGVKIRPERYSHNDDHLDPLGYNSHKNSHNKRKGLGIMY